MLPFIEKNKIRTAYLPKVIIKMRLGGTTNKNFDNIKTQNKEIIQILRDYYQDFSVFQFWIYKAINRFSQFINRPKTLGNWIPSSESAIQ